DVGAQEDHQVGLFAFALVIAEQRAQDGNGAQDRHGVRAAGDPVFQQAAQHHDLPVVQQHAGVDGALVGDDAAFHLGGFVDVGDFLVDVQLDGAAFRDLRAYAQLQADFLALYGLEGVVVGAAAGDVLPADERHGLAHQDGGGLVVQGQDVGRGQDVGPAFALQRARQQVQVHDLAHARDVDAAVEDAQRQAARQHVHRVGRPGLEVGPAQVGAADETAIVAHPLDAQLRSVVLGHFHDQAFHQHLRAPLVQHVDDPAQAAVHGFGGGDDQRIGGGIGLHGDAGGGERTGA